MKGTTNAVKPFGLGIISLINITTEFDSTITFFKNGIIIKQFLPEDGTRLDTNYSYWSYNIYYNNIGDVDIIITNGVNTKTIKTRIKPYEDQNITVYFYKYMWTPFRLFTSSSLTSDSWLDTVGSTYLTKNAGTWTVENSKLIADGSTRYNTTTTNSFFLFGITCSIDSSFTPVSSSNWYQQSCIMGQEITNTQNDFGMTIIKSNNELYLAIGYGNKSYTMASVPISTNEDHTLFIFHITNSYYLWQDGELVATVSYTASGTNVTTPGIFWNKSGTGTTVKGTISKIGFWTYAQQQDAITDNIKLPAF